MRRRSNDSVKCNHFTTNNKFICLVNNYKNRFNIRIIMDAQSPFSGLLKTRRIEPLFHSRARSEFRLNDPSEATLTNLRLVNIGAVLAQGNAPKGPHDSIGLHSLIKHIRLEANGREIDSQRFYNRLALFREGIVDTNDDQISMQVPLARSRLGLVNQASTGAQTGPLITLGRSRAAPGEANKMTDDPNTTVTAMIELRNVLGFLRAAPLLHPAAMGEIRLIIEYEPVDENIVLESNRSIAAVLPPTLITTYSRDPRVIDQAVMSLAQPITFSTFFSDSNILAGTVAGGKSVTPFQFKAFDGHYVQRMLQIQEPLRFNTQLNPVKFQLQSVPRYRATDKIIVNGVPLFGASGIDSVARRNTILHDAFEGAHTHPPGFDTIGQIGDATSGGDEYTGYLIGQHVAILQTEVGRTTVSLSGGTDPETTKTNLTCIVRMFGEVFRTRMPNGVVVALSTK